MWILTLIAVALVQGGMSATSNCPTVCVCKWKGGKQTVECTDKNLALIPDDVDPETQVLDMSGNNLQTLGGETFVRTGLLNLQKLYLRNCRLGRIDDRALRGLTNLVELDLSHNLLTNVPSAIFKDVPYLRELVLARNPIQKIQGHAFMTLPGLVKLDLSNCDLRTISTNAFEGVQLVESLKLNGNRLREMPRTIDSLGRLNVIEMHDNPWHCDCHLREVKIWLTNKNNPYLIPPRCNGGPERIIGKSFSELSIEDFACRPEIRLDNRLVEAATGDNATVVCRVDSVPEAVVTWYWNGHLLQNNTVFNSYQRAYVIESGTFEKKSMLIVTNAQESDSGGFYCIAENRAGNAEANYTVHVSYRMAGMASLGSGQIAGLSAALVVLILFILLIILIMLVRLRRTPFSESKTPGGTVEVVANGSIVQKPSTPVTIESSQLAERKEPVAAPVPAESPSDAPNPDLINDTGEDPRPGSGEYMRSTDHWEEGGYLVGDRTPIVEDYPADYGLPIPGGAPLPSAKTLRVWQRGVPVLPPVNALKRVLNRNSPDEGYQEGCGTDV